MGLYKSWPSFIDIPPVVLEILGVIQPLPQFTEPKKPSLNGVKDYTILEC
tara:strand:- start:369 stop:518 length:150 start_codon:yes stop_codon:yes gene_type:complete